MRWMNCRNYQVSQDLVVCDHIVPNPDDLVKLKKEEICKVLCMFVIETRNTDGLDYIRDTLYDLIVIVQSFLKQKRHPLKFFEDEMFFDLKNTLDNRMKDLSKQGKFAPSIKMEPIFVSEEEMLWNMKILGDDTPEKLVDTLLYLNGLHFALHVADKHKSLKMNLQLTVGYGNSVGLKYLEYKECTSKCNQVGLMSRFIKPKVSCAYQNVTNADRCMVRLFEKYVSHHPDHDPKCSKDFYLHPLSNQNGNVWYSCQPRGRHTLGEVVKNLCKKAGLSEKRTKHSLRACTATRMYEGGLDE